MNFKRYRILGIGVIALALSLAWMGGAKLANADGFGFGGGGLHRLVADYQNNSSISGGIAGCAGGEICTNLSPDVSGGGGQVVYTRSVTIPDNTVFITFSAQGDAHLGSALLMTASVTDSAGNVTYCQPLAGQTEAGGGGSHLQTGWYTLLHLPDAGTGSNCNDGGGGAADCHDTAISFTCCATVTPDSTEDSDFERRSSKRKTFGGGDDDGDSDTPTTHTINIKLADLPGGGLTANASPNIAFYERSTIYVDSANSSKSNPLCAAHDAP